MALPKGGAGPAKPAADMSAAQNAKLDQIHKEIQRGNINQETGMQKLMQSLKHDIISNALGPIMKVLDAINKLMSLLIMPFANLLMPLLLPILYFLTPVARFLNVALRPLFIQLMEWAKSQKGAMSAAAGKMQGGDIGGAIGDFTKIIGEGVKILIDGLKPYIDAVLKAINIDGLIKMAQEKIQGIIDFVSAMLGDAKSGISEWLTKVWDMISKIDIAQMLSDTVTPYWTTITGWFVELKTKFDSAVSSLEKSLGSSIKDAVATFSSDFNKYLNDLWNGQIMPTLQYYYNQYISPFFGQILSTLKESIAAGFSSLVAQLPGAAGKSALDFGGKVIGKAGSLAGEVFSRIGMDDFISRPGQPLQSINSQDTVVGFKGNAPAGMGGGPQNLNLTIRLVDSMGNQISSQRLQASSGTNMTFTV